MVYHSTTKKGGVETRCRVTSLFSHGNRQLVQPGENITLYCNATESPFGKSLKFTWLKKVLATTTTKWSFKRNFRPNGWWYLILNLIFTQGRALREGEDWSKVYQRTKRKMHNQFKHSSSKIEIVSASWEDAGEYTCKVTNVGGQSNNRSTTITVQGKENI